MAVLKEIFSLGMPIAVTITAEAGLFSAVSILVGTRGASVTAAHQIALNFAATMFMIPLALSAATTVRIGHALGSGNACRCPGRGHGRHPHVHRIYGLFGDFPLVIP